MLRPALLIARKDLATHLKRKSTSLVQAILLGLLLVFLFSLSLRVGEVMSAQAATAVFWMSSSFCMVLIFSSLYAQEESAGQRRAILLAPIYPQSVWLGKATAGFLLLLLAQLFFFPATLVFLGQTVASGWQYAVLVLLAADVGMAALGSLLGALSQGDSAKESLFTVLLFPLLVPLLLAAVQVGTLMFEETTLIETSRWFGVAIAFDAIFLAAGLFLFPYIFTADE